MNYLPPEVYAGIDLSHLTGCLPFPMTNDYLFRAVMQENNRVLKALVCSLLQIDEKEIREVRILNPIELGRSVDEKDFFLDIRVILDSRIIVNLEMQVINEGNWVERSQCYLCRSFDGLNKGENYRNVLPAVQIGILNYTLFPEAPEFYATYRLMNVKSHKIYSDKLRLSVLHLNQVELATEDDRKYQLDSWAHFFKAATWEEMRKLAEHNPIFSEAVRTAVVLSREEEIRLRCEAREDYYRRTGWKDEQIMMQDWKISQLSSENQQLSSKNQRLSSKNQRLSSKNQQLSSENQQLTSEVLRLRRLLEASGVSDNEKG